MATGTRNRNELIHCDNCGEDYSPTYKRCPFCDEKAGERRTNTRGGGYGGGVSPSQVIGMVVSVALIAVAIWIVVALVAPKLRPEAIEADPGSTNQVDPVDTQNPNDVDPNATATDPDATGTPEDPDASPSTTPEAPVSTITAITLNQADFTLSGVGESYRMVATLAPDGATDTLTWESSDATIASISPEGVVTAISNGMATVTASAGNVTAECIVRVRNQPDSGTSGETPATNTPSSELKISQEDVTIVIGETFTLSIDGATSVTWTTSNSSVATVDASGKVTGVGSSGGGCTITGTANGETFTCIVRVR